MLRGALWLGLLVALFAIFFYAYNKFGLNYRYKKHHPGQCRHVNGLDFSSEDMQVTDDGLAFITSGVHYSSSSPSYREFLKENKVHGGIFLYDFKKPTLGARRLKIRPSKNFDLGTFHPHGISVLEDKVKGEHLLYVINHPRGGKDRVEKFRFTPGVNELTHVRFFNDSKFTITNDLALVGEDKFYIGNFLNFESVLMGMVEQLLPLPLGKLFYVDGNDVTEVVSGLHGPNGVTLSKDKKFLYVALPLDGTMHVYERQKNNGLKFVQDIPELHSCLDNFHLSQDGNSLYAGAHPVPHKTMAYLHDPRSNLTSPSSVLQLPLSNGRVVTDEITELFYDHGDLISGSSVAHVHSNQLLIGSVIHKLVVCDLAVVPTATGVPAPGKK